MMDYCPGCQEPLQKNEEQCSFCGYELIATKQEDDEDFSAIASKKSFFKSGAFIGSVISLVIIGAIIGGTVFGFNYFRQNQEDKYKKDLKSIWLEVNNRSEQVVSSLESVKTPSDLKNFKEDLVLFSDFLTRKQTELVSLEPPEKYKDNQSVLVDEIQKLGKYIFALKLLVQKDPNKVEAPDYAKVKKLAQSSDNADEKFVIETAFIDERMPSEIFDALETIRPIIEKAQKQSKAKKKQSLDQKLKADKRAAEKTVRLFMQARIDKSAAEIRRYITPDYDKIFDPEQEFDMSDTFSVDFKITSTENKSAKEFQINGDEISKDLTGEKFTNKWWFKVIDYENDWLIDDRKLLEE